MAGLAAHSSHLAEGAQLSTFGGVEVVWSYGAAEEEYRALREAAGVLDLSTRGLLRLTGPDRVSFLHGMVTQDINAVPDAGVTYAALLTAKGAMVSDARVLRRSDELLLDVEPGCSARVLEFLSRYLISEDAEVVDVAGQVGALGVYGPAAGRVLDAVGASLPEPGRLAEAGEGFAAFDGQLGVPGALLYAPALALPALWQRLGAAARSVGGRAVGHEALETLRIEAGVPRFGQDMDEATIPLEANLQAAISYNKGCYIGQEVIARATFRGHMNRKLAGLALGAARPPDRAELRRGEKKVGLLTSIAFSRRLGRHLALGYVHRDSLEPGTELAVAGYDGMAVVSALPFA